MSAGLKYPGQEIHQDGNKISQSEARLVMEGEKNPLKLEVEAGYQTVP